MRIKGRYTSSRFIAHNIISKSYFVILEYFETPIIFKLTSVLLNTFIRGTYIFFVEEVTYNIKILFHK